MSSEDKKIVSEVRNALGTTYILVGAVVYVLYYLFFSNSIIGLILLLSEPIISAVAIIFLKLRFVKDKININNWPAVRNTTIGLLLLLAVFLGIQNFLIVIMHIIASITLYFYLKP